MQGNDRCKKECHVAALGSTVLAELALRRQWICLQRRFQKHKFQNAGNLFRILERL